MQSLRRLKSSFPKCSKSHIYNTSLLYCFPLLLCWSRQLVGIQCGSSAHCVWSVQRPGHPPGQSRGKGVCQKRCPQQTEPSLGTALWSALPPPPSCLRQYQTIDISQTHSQACFPTFLFYIRFLMLFWLKFPETSGVILDLFLPFCFSRQRRKKVGAGWGGGERGDQAPAVVSFRVMEDSVWALIMVKPRPSGCPDARGTLPAYLVPRMSNPPLGTCQPHLKHGLDWGRVPFNSFGFCISDPSTKN